MEKMLNHGHTDAVMAGWVAGKVPLVRRLVMEEMEAHQAEAAVLAEQVVVLVATVAQAHVAKSESLVGR